MADRREKDHPPSLKGYFIISESNMSDPNFYQTVVYIMEHNTEGAFGLVVNRKSHLSLSDILPDFQNDRGKSTPVYVGGPVQQEYLFVLHSELPENENSSTNSSSTPGVYFEPAFGNLEKYFRDETWSQIPVDDRPSIHLYLGYSGWGPGQLEREMEHGSWMVLKATPKIIFHPNPEEGWKDALREKGGIYRVFADFSPDPGLN